MRCKNCGWNNPDNADECEKCHSRLRPLNNPNRPSATRPDGKVAPRRNNGMKATVMNVRPDFDPFTPKASDQPTGAAESIPQNDPTPSRPQPTRIAKPDAASQIYEDFQSPAYSLQPIMEDGTPYDEPLLIDEGDIVVIGNERFLFSRRR